jgi:hypothetical protein
MEVNSKFRGKGSSRSEYIVVPARSFSRAGNYMQGMTKWVQFARQGKQGTTVDGVPPVNAPATPEWADKLEERLHLLRFAVKPSFDDGNGEPPVN